MNLTIITLEPYQYQVTETITKTIPSEQVTTGTETVTGIIENKTIEENITRTETSYKEISQINPLAIIIIITGLIIVIFCIYKIKS